MQTSSTFAAPRIRDLKVTRSENPFRSGIISNECTASCVVLISATSFHAAPPPSTAWSAAPNASNQRASSGTTIFWPDATIPRKNSTIAPFWAVPPINKMFFAFPRRTSSDIFPAIIRQSPPTTRDLASPLFSACVQSLLQKTEHRPATWYGESMSTACSASSTLKRIRLICCRKNSPVPDAHLLPVKMSIIRPVLSIL